MRGQKMLSISPEDQEVVNKVEEIIHKEGKNFNFSKVVFELLREFVKVHGDGNPHSTLDQYQDPNFMVTPALFRDEQIWEDYMSKIRGTPEFVKLREQLTLLGDLFEKHEAISHDVR